MSNYSTIHDLVMRVSAILQVNVASLGCLPETLEFDFYNKDIVQQILPNILMIKPKLIKYNIAIIEAIQEQNDIFRRK